MHSTTYRIRAKQIEYLQAVDQRIKDAIDVGEHYTDEDRKVAEDIEARDLFRAFLAEEF